MASAVPVHEVKLAAGTWPAWASSFLSPLCAAIKLEPRGILLRKVGNEFLAYADGDLTSNPDQLIVFKPTVRFYTRRQLIDTYLHESAHLLLNEAERQLDGPEFGHSHDAAFLAVFATLLIRSDEFLKHPEQKLINRISLYDIQDFCPGLSDYEHAEQVTISLRWALSQAHKYAPMELAALDVAKAVCTSYWAWCDELEKLPKKIAEEAVKKARDKAREDEQRKALKADLQLYKMLSVLLGVAFLAFFYVGL